VHFLPAEGSCDPVFTECFDQSTTRGNTSMTTELAALGVAVLFQMVLGILATVSIGQVAGADWLLSSREKAVDFGTTAAGRLARARDNGFEALILFTAAVAMVALTSSSSDLTIQAAWTFVAARAIYTVCYAFNLVPWRTLVWFVGSMATLVLVVVALMKLAA
jgi:uncharacterized MAPEG superfamily protein